MSGDRAAISSTSPHSTPGASPRGTAPIPVVEADENLEDNDLIELVDVGVIPAVVVDSHKAELWAKIFDSTSRSAPISR